MGTADAICRLAASPDDRHAWEAAVIACQGLCWRIALRMLGPDAAPDAVQDTLLALRQAARGFRPGADAEGSAVAWTARIAVNTCQHHRRRQATHSALPLAAIAEPAIAPGAAPDPELQAQLAAALDELPAEQREAVALRYLAGLDFAAVASAAGVRQGAARMRVQRGLAALRTALDRRGVAVSALVLATGLEQLAGTEVPPPPPSATAAWSAAPLLPVAAPVGGLLAASLSSLVASHSGAIVMTTVLTAGLIAMLALPALHPQPIDGPAGTTVAAAETPAPQMDDVLAWLGQRQAADGSWGLAGRDTASILLLFIGAGYDHQQASRHRTIVAAAVAWLVAHPDAAGDVRQTACETIALHDLQFMSADAKLVEPAAAALRRLLALQQGDGWPARRGAEGIDLAATAHAVVALNSVLFWQSSIELGLEEPRDHAALQRIRDASTALRTLLGATGGMIATAYAGSPLPILPAQLPATALAPGAAFAPGAALAPGAPGGDAAALAIATTVNRNSAEPWMTQLARRLLASDRSAWTSEQYWFASIGCWNCGTAFYQQFDPTLHTQALRGLGEALHTGNLGDLASAGLQEQMHVRWSMLQVERIEPAVPVPSAAPNAPETAPEPPPAGRS